MYILFDELVTDLIFSNAMQSVNSYTMIAVTDVATKAYVIRGATVQ